ncbi:unnamed protein product [Penicillium pancosmium]
MWGASILPITVLAALPCANAITLHKHDHPAVLEFPISRSEWPQALQKRSSKVARTALYNLPNLYYMLNITVGTPAQSLSLSVDTGSSDMWVNVPNSTYCAGDDDSCSSTGLFDIKDSSTFKLLDYDINSTYLDTFLAAGPYATDTLVIGGATIENMEFVVADESINPNGILGIGYAGATYAAVNLQKEYNNLPEALVKSGVIKSAAYSLWLNESDGHGKLLFGGVNKARYQGELQTVPVLQLDGRYLYMAIALTDISVKSSKGSKSYQTGLPLAVTLDNGSPLISLPKELIDPIYKEVGGGYSSTDGYGYIPCSMAKADYNVTFNFSGAMVTIPISELVFEDYTEPDFADGDCIFGLGYSESGVNLMGEPFLRGAYVVYDLANNEISLANVNNDGGEDNIHEIGTGTAAVPGATLMPSPVTSATGNGPNKTAGSVDTMAYVTATATGAAKSGGATSTSSKGLAASATGKSNHLLSGVLGAGLLLAL